MASSSIYSWGSDVPISMPEPLDDRIEVQVDMDALCFTRSGIAHNFRRADLEVFTYPMFAPSIEGVSGGEIPGS